MDINRIRAVIGAIIPLLSFAFLGSGIITNDWYSGEAERDTEADIGWWNATVDYGAFNGTIWVGENDNLIGLPDYERYTMNYTGSDRALVLGPVLGLLASMMLCLITLVFGLLTASRIVGWKIPFVICSTAFLITLISVIVLYTGIPDIADSDLDELRLVFDDAIPEDEMHILENNLTHGGSFTWIYGGLPGLLVSPLLFIGIKRQKLPPSSRIEDNFFLDKKESLNRKEKMEIPRRPRTPRSKKVQKVTSGSLDDDS